jgi:polyhydroxyalkanoate synthase
MEDVIMNRAEAGPRGADTTGQDSGALGPFRISEALSSAASLFSASQAGREALSFGLETAKILAGRSTIELPAKDPRFKDPAWGRNPLLRRLLQTYLASCKALEGSIDGTRHWRDRERAKLLVDMVTSTISPSNFLPTNPAALRKARETRGGSLVHGALNFLHDLRHNGGMPSQVDKSAFTVGKNIAVTPGAVVFRNEVLEIIQYKPQTARVMKRPVLLMTPQINKYYFLDLSPGRSLIEYAVKNGIQLFVVSWRNPDRQQSHWNLDTYVQALIEATDAVREICGTEDLNTFGFCAGGITMSTMLGHLAHIGDQRVHSASYAVTLLDFSVPAMIGCMQSHPLLQVAQRNSRRLGVLPGRDLARVFSWVRPNDLVWNYWVNNYLMGNPPPTFDILAWNADPTNLPAGLHADFLKIFAENSLRRPGRWKALGSPVDLRKVKIDTFVTGAVTDHLTPWQGCYRTTQMLGGNSTFLLSNAGHIASLVNPPGNPKATYWMGGEAVPDPEVWRKNATQRTGTWWEVWLEWIRERSGEERAAPRSLGSAANPPLEPAPGTYVMAC